jgi:hypothetical protein
LLQSIDCDQQIGPLKNFHQLFENAFVVLGSGLKIFLKYSLRVTNGLKRQLLISHGSSTLKQLVGPADKGRIQAEF